MNIFFVLLFLSLFHEKVEGDAAQIEIVDSKPGDPLSIPLISDGGAPLVAMLDTSSMNVRIKSFIKTLMGKMIDESLTADSTTDIIRNITKLELNEELVNIVMTHVTFREQIQNIVKETLKQNSTIDLIRNIAVQELDGQLRQRNQSEDKVISDSDQDIEFDNISKPFGVTDTKGNEFHLGFLTSHNQNGKLYLYIVSTTDGSCQIFIPFLNINSSFAISNTSINSYDISPTVFMDQHGIQRKAIHVKCNIPVSIYGLTFTGNEVDGYLALPSKLLANKYIVSSFTPFAGEKPLSNSNFGIIGIDKSTNVTINIRITGGSVKYNNIHYKNNDTLSIQLTQFDTFYLSSQFDLSGTLVAASNPVAVMSGVRTSYIRNGWGNHMEEMILPNEQLGRDFIVPKLYDSQCNFRIFAPEHSRVRIYDNSLIQYTCTDIQRGRFHEFENYDIYTLQSSAPVQVQLYCNGVSSTADAFMVTLPSIQHFKSSYTYPVVNDFAYNKPPEHFYITVIVRSNARMGLRLDDKDIVKYEMITNITLASTLYSVITVEQSVGLHEIKQHNDIPFGLIVFGRNKYSGYGFPAGFATNIHP